MIGGERLPDNRLDFEGLHGPFDVTDIIAHDGRTAIVKDIGVVPIPTAIWLFGTALIGLVGFRKRRKSV